MVAVASYKVVHAFVELTSVGAVDALIGRSVNGSAGCGGFGVVGLAVTGAAAVVANALGLGDALGLALATRFKLTAAIVGVVVMAAVTGASVPDAAIEGKLSRQFWLEVGPVAD